MLFSSLTFLFIFLPFTLLVYYLSKDKYKNYILLFSSLIFYSWGEPKYLILMILSIVMNYFLAIFIDKSVNNKKRKFLLLISIMINIGILFIFKYLQFFITNTNNLLSLNIKVFNISLPIGISFYIFQILSYVIDVYKGNVKVQKNIFYLGTYITLFPQLIAGPIVRYSTVECQLKNRVHSLDKFTGGLKRFIIGLGKKVIIANNVALIADTIFNSAQIEQYSGVILLIAALAYTFQIYFDFSGYSDMAIGLGKMFGFDFLENFNYPYISQSITEFWRRWHISLSSFFKDYVYIPLGGNRVSKIKWIRNIFIVWCLTGLWHGANWNFIIWGLYFAIILLIEKIFFSKILQRIPMIFRWLYSFILINIGWIIFRLEDLSTLKYVLTNIISFDNNSIQSFLMNNYNMLNYIPYMFLAIIFSFPVVNLIEKKINNKRLYLCIKDLFIIIIFIFSIFLLLSNTYNPFIYFRF